MLTTIALFVCIITFFEIASLRLPCSAVKSLLTLGLGSIISAINFYVLCSVFCSRLLGVNCDLSALCSALLCIIALFIFIFTICTLSRCGLST